MVRPTKSASSTQSLAPPSDISSKVQWRVANSLSWQSHACWSIDRLVFLNFLLKLNIVVSCGEKTFRRLASFTCMFRMSKIGPFVASTSKHCSPGHVHGFAAVAPGGRCNCRHYAVILELKSIKLAGLGRRLRISLPMYIHSPTMIATTSHWSFPRSVKAGTASIGLMSESPARPPNWIALAR
jgi:hypothetical protein